MRFRKKPIIIEAQRYLHQDESGWWNGLREIVVGRDSLSVLHYNLEVPTLEGTMYASEGDWIITGIKGEKYPCKDEIFRATYDPVDEE